MKVSGQICFGGQSSACLKFPGNAVRQTLAGSYQYWLRRNLQANRPRHALEAETRVHHGTVDRTASSYGKLGKVVDVRRELDFRVMLLQLEDAGAVEGLRPPYSTRATGQNPVAAMQKSSHAPSAVIAFGHR